MVANSFTRKQLRVTLTLLNNRTFGDTGSNTLILSGLRISANIKAAGAPLAPAAQLQVYGMKQADMNELTMLAWKPLDLQRNIMTVEANSGSQWTKIFEGVLIDAGPDYSSAPDAFLRLNAVALYLENLQPIEPLSYTAGASVADIVKTIADRMGKTFENNGVTATLNKPYLPNTLFQQLIDVCDHSRTDLYIDVDTIAICPRGQPRAVTTAFLNPQSGLIGYPTVDRVGIQLMAIFDPALKFGGPVQVESIVPKANGIWRIYSIDHFLESEKPGGAWFSTLGCSEFGKTVIP